MTVNVPRHTRNIPDDRKAIAPYNFVPLPETVVTIENLPDHDRYDTENRYTGYVECTLTTLTPFYTRSMMNPDFFKEYGEKKFEELTDEQQKERAKPFHLLEIPVIPGSSLHGMTRNLVEIAAYGKVAWVTDRQLSYRNIGDEYYRRRLLRDDGKHKVNKAGKNRRKPVPHSTPLARAGYFEQYQGEWFIRPAKNIGGTTFARILKENIPEDLESWHNCKNARKIWVKLGRYEYQDVKGGFIQLRYTPVLDAKASAQHGFLKAVLAYSGDIDKKKHEAVIFTPDMNAPRIPVSEKLIEAYRDQMSQEQIEILGKNGVLNPCQPVFYLMDGNKLVFFGHTHMFRLPYPHTPNDFIPDDINADKQTAITDYAEAIFGYTDGSGSRPCAYAGRVFFEDAHLVSCPEDGWVHPEPIHPKILSSPKPTTFQHYLTQSDEGARNKKNLYHYASTPGETTIRGHKLYWHKKGKTIADIQETDRKKIGKAKSQYTRIQPVKPGVIFRFKIHFENLSQEELGALLWVLDLPPGHHHKLGMGKPLGMGSIKIEPKLYISNQRERYVSLFAGSGGWQTGVTQETSERIQDFKQAFEKHILENLKQQDLPTGNSLTELERIQSLLKLLEWPGPDPKMTQYMEIEKFGNRPVLPHSLDVGKVTSTNSASLVPPPTRKQRISSKYRSSTHPQAGRGKQQQATSGIKVPQVGDIFTGKVEKVWSDGMVIVQYKNYPTTQIRARIAPENLQGKHFQPGNPARCQVISVTQQSGVWILNCKPGPKPVGKKKKKS